IAPASSEDAGDIEIPQTDVDATRPERARWFHDRALLKGLKTAASDALFGDFFLTWSEQGLHLATVSMDYLDPILLAEKPEFPRDDAFRIDLGVDAGAAPHRFEVLMLPIGNVPHTMNSPMRVEVCERDGPRCVRVPSAIATDLGSNRTRIREAIFFPWSALGLAGPPPGETIRMQLGATSFYRSRWMSLSGKPPAKALQNESEWRVARLEHPPTRDGDLIPVSLTGAWQSSNRGMGRVRYWK
ncbi:MAG TPA: hypothetical protein VMT64_04725, partial [Candidatus Binataceae bacterium]|nr:hypothetical protein [Candidatus Binataceae bacterium]